MTRSSLVGRAFPMLAAILFLIPAATAQDWPMFGYIPAGGRYNTSETTIGVSNVDSLSPIWSFDTGGYAATPPAIESGIAYFGTGSGNVYAVNAQTGAEIWDFLADSEIVSPPGGGQWDCLYRELRQLLRIEQHQRNQNLEC
jgi:glucose dehydrogenase